MIPKASAFATFAEDADFSAVSIRVKTDRRQSASTSLCRGDVRGFSRKSRKRLFDLLSSVPHSVLSPGVLFVTLTYPSRFPTDHEIYKANLQAFLKRLYRKLGRRVPVIWRLEFQRRGAPHFHLVILGLERLDMGWVSEAWYEVVGTGDIRHLLAGTNVKRVSDRKAILSYISKYMAKEGQSPNGVIGRVWGVWSKDLLGIVLTKVQVSVRFALEIRAEMLKFLHRKGVDIDKFTAFGVMSMTCYGFPLKKVLAEGV